MGALPILMTNTTRTRRGGVADVRRQFEDEREGVSDAVVVRLSIGEAVRFAEWIRRAERRAAIVPRWSKLAADVKAAAQQRPLFGDPA